MRVFMADSFINILCFIGFLLFPLCAKAGNEILFIENRSQWPGKVLFAAEIPGGKLFVEKDRLVYLLSESRQHGHLHYAEKNDRHARLSVEQASKNTSDYVQDTLWEHAFEIRFVGSNPNVKTKSEGTIQTRYNYFLGNNPDQWAINVAAYSAVILMDIFPHIDLKLYSMGEQVKYDFVVHPKGNVKHIKMEYKGVDELALIHKNIHITTRLGKIIEKKPYTYQISNGIEHPVASEFQLANNIITFNFPEKYDKKTILVIDPEVVFSAYSGSTSDNWGNTATYDASGNLYSAGIVRGSGYPVTIGAYQTSHAGGRWDIGIMKYDAQGNQVLYATYLGGRDSETPQSLFVNNSGELLILGTTSSTNFPVTNASTYNGGVEIEPMDGVAYDNGSDIFIAKLSADGSQLLGGTYLGGSHNDGINFISGEFDTRDMVESPLCKNYGDQFRGDIITDADDNVYIASNTMSPDFPVVETNTPFGGGLHDALLVKLKPDLSDIVWSRFLGGSGTDAAYSLKLDKDNHIFITGGTNSNDFQGINAYQTSYAGGIDGWVADVSPDGIDIINATYFGTAQYDQAYFVDLDLAEEVYLYGQTQGNYPVTDDVYSEVGGGQFIHKFSKDLKSSVFSTVFGSGGYSPDISPTAFLVSDCNNIYLAGWGGVLNTTTITIRTGGGPSGTTQITRNFVGGDTNGLRVSDNAFQRSTSGSDFYLMVLGENASSFLYGTYMGGGSSFTHVDGGTSRFDKSGTVYHAVCASCGGYSDFPAVNPPEGHAQNRARTGAACNNAAFKFDLTTLNASLQTNSVTYDNPGVDTLCLSEEIVFQNLSSGAQYYQWDLSDGTLIDTVSATKDIVHQYENTGTYTVTLKAYNDELCDN